MLQQRHHISQMTVSSSEKENFRPCLIKSQVDDSSNVDAEQHQIGQMKEADFNPSKVPDYSEINENDLMRKIDYRVLPWITVLQFFTFLDRTAIGEFLLLSLIFSLPDDEVSKHLLDRQCENVWSCRKS